MPEKRILFVEDNLQEQEWFESAVGEWNENSEPDDRSFSMTLCANTSEAEAALKEGRFDCALFDLRIPSGRRGRPTEPAGNDLARIAVKEYGIPVAIISGNMAELDPELREIGPVGLFDKGVGDPYNEAIRWFGENWKMMSILDATRRRMRSSAAEVFWKRVWPRWAALEQLEGVTESELTGIVTRQYIGHMAELLGLDDPANATWHPFENYVSPALQSGRAHTGDIFELVGKLWVVLTPQCDMATQAVENVVLAECERGDPELWRERIQWLKNPSSNREQDKGTRFFRELVNQNLPPSEHFLPPLPGEDYPLFVKFKNIRATSLVELNSKLRFRKVSIAAPFLGNLIQRFGAYMSRMGQPNINIQHFN